MHAFLCILQSFLVEFIWNTIVRLCLLEIRLRLGLRSR